ncbi:hypothetical protein [Rhizorhabdus argentea]
MGLDRSAIRPRADKALAGLMAGLPLSLLLWVGIATIAVKVT